LIIPKPGKKIAATWFEIQIWICVQDECGTEKCIQNSNRYSTRIVIQRVTQASMHFWDLLCLNTACSAHDFRPGCSQENMQLVWSSPLTEIRAVGCVWVIAVP
jgi:hypothetical protein